MTARQLHLFKEQRLKATPSALEFKIACALADTIDLLIYRDRWIWSALPFGEHRNAITAARLKRMGTRAGFFDYVFLGPSGTVFWLELKRRTGGRLNDAQKSFRDFLEANEHDHAVAHGYDEAIDALEVRGIIRRVEVQ